MNSRREIIKFKEALDSLLFTISLFECRFLKSLCYLILTCFVFFSGKKTNFSWIVVNRWNFSQFSTILLFIWTPDLYDNKLILCLFFSIEFHLYV